MSVLEILSHQALAVLHEAQSPLGTRAASVPMANYQAVFCRDAVVTGLQGLAENDPVRIEGLITSLHTLRKHQGPQGQIPSNVRIEQGNVTVSFGRLSPKIDSVSWYVLGCARLIIGGHSVPELWLASVQSAISLLETLEFNASNLIYVPRGGNWADEYLTEGYTLFDQSLRSWSLREAGIAFNRHEWLQKSSAISELLLSHYTLDSGYFASSLLPGFVDRRIDLAAHCVLAMAMNPGEPSVVRALKLLAKNTLERGVLPPAFQPIITSSDPEWPALEGFHLFGMKNRPHHYHNGGIWWIWVAWFGMSLRRHHLGKEVTELVHLAKQVLNLHPEFNFEEYYASDDLSLGGTPKLCFTATGIRILAQLDHE